MAQRKIIFEKIHCFHFVIVDGRAHSSVIIGQIVLVSTGLNFRVERDEKQVNILTQDLRSLFMLITHLAILNPINVMRTMTNVQVHSDIKMPTIVNYYTTNLILEYCFPCNENLHATVEKEFSRGEKFFSCFQFCFSKISASMSLSQK